MDQNKAFREYVCRMLGYAPDYEGRIMTPHEMGKTRLLSDDFPTLVSIGQNAIKFLNSVPPPTKE